MKETTPTATRQHKTPLALQMVRAGLRGLSWVAPPLAARLAYRLWFYPRRHDEPRRERSWREAAKQSWLQHQTETLAMYRWGEGPVVLLIHGWDGRGTQMGAFAEPLVAAGYQAIAIDLPAHGRSTGKRTNMLEAAAAINAVAEATGPLAGVIAHSFGAGALARSLANGIDTRKAVLISPPANLRWMAENYYELLGINTGIASRIEKLMHAQYGETIWQQVSADHNLAGVSIPGLIVHDSKDRDVPVAQGELLEQAWPQARLVKTSGLGHRRILRDANVIQSCIDFIRQDQ